MIQVRVSYIGLRVRVRVIGFGAGATRGLGLTSIREVK